MAVTVPDLSIGAVDEKLAPFAAGNFPPPIGSLTLGFHDFGNPFAAFSADGPFFSMWDHMDILLITHSVW